MNLHRSVSRFMTDTISNPYDANATIKGAIKLYNEVTNSGPASRRRILETGPDDVMFADRVIKRGLDIYLVGGANSDTWRGEALRLKYPLLPVDHTAIVTTPAKVIANTAVARVTYTYPHYVKGISLEMEESDKGSDFSLYFSIAETVVKGNIVKLDEGTYYKIRNVPFEDGAGFKVAGAYLMPTPVQTLTLNRASGYNPSTDTITSASSGSVTAIVEDSYLAYDHTSERFTQIKPGDKTITVKPLTPPLMGDTFGALKILSIDTDADGCSVCHCRG